MAKTQKRTDYARAFRFSEDELAVLDAMALKHGGQKAAVMAGLRALERANDISQADVIAAIKRNWKGK